MKAKPQLRSFAITESGLTTLTDVPESVAHLANALYGYIVEPRPPLKATKSKTAAPSKGNTARQVHVIFGDIDEAASLPPRLGGHSWRELSGLRLETVMLQTNELLDRWVLESSGEHPSGMSAAYGLIRLDQAWDGEKSSASRLEAACVAGRCLGAAAFAAGLVRGVSRTVKKASTARWEPRDELVAWVREQYSSKKWKNKAEFIRHIQQEVLARSQQIELGMTPTSVAARIRKWIAGL